MNWKDELNYFLDCFVLSGLGSFVVDCPIKSTSSSSVFPNNVPKKQSDRIRRYYKRNDLGISFDMSLVLKTFTTFVSGSKEKAGSKCG